MLVMPVGAGAAYFAWRAHALARALERATNQHQGLETSQRTLQQRLQALQDQYLQLSQAHQSLEVDRNNLLSQVAQARAESERHQQLAAERDLLETLLKKTAEEQRLLRAQLPDLEHRLQELQQANEQLRQTEERLTQELAQAESRSQEKQLQQQLAAQRQEAAAQRKEAQELTRLLRAMQRELGETQKVHASTVDRLKTFQKHYTDAAAENSTLRRQTKQMPKEVNQMAREHQRLLKETADMHYNLGVLLSRNKEYVRAAAEFRKVIELRPDDPDPYYNLGVIYAEHVPDREKALEHFRHYLQLNPQAQDASWVKQYIASWKAWEGKERLE